MPNWCYTDITFTNAGYPKSGEALNDFYKKISDQVNGDKNLSENGFGPSWEGNICILFGLETDETLSNDTNNYRCRGNIMWLDDDDCDGISFSLTQEDAWGPNVYLWRDIILKNYSFTDNFGNVIPLINMYYKAEEPGMEIYATNDKNGDIFSGESALYFEIPIEPNIFNFCTQNPGSPFMKINKDLLDKYGIYMSNYRDGTGGIFYDTSYDTQEYNLKLLNEVLFKTPANNYDDAKKIIDEYNTSQTDYIGVINFNTFMQVEIDDVDSYHSRA